MKNFVMGATALLLSADQTTTVNAKDKLIIKEDTLM